jgi:serine/threonine-protein kinase
VAVLVAALVLGGAGWWFAAGPGAWTTTPEVVGEPVAEAEQLLTAQGLAARVGERFDDSVPAGTVVDTDPGPGADVRKGGTVDVFVSAGPEFLPVPSVTGATREDAATALTGAQLEVGEVTEEFSEDVEAGRVISQSVPADETLRRGEPVDLVVSKGRRPIDVPDVAGTPQADAERAVTDAGLSVGEVTTEPSETVARGVVIRQAPEGGTLFRGDAVSLVVSSGPPLVEVPALRGRQVDEARRILVDAGFEVRVERLLGGVFGTVHSTDPEAGSEVPKGSTVTVRIV